jgi:hypothetical protein
MDFAFICENRIMKPVEIFLRSQEGTRENNVGGKSN